MKIAITSNGNDLKSKINPRFGRCKYFIIYDTESEEYEAVQNSNAFASGGAGVSSAQMVSEKGVKAVITGKVGPKAFRALKAASIKVFPDASGTVEDAVKQFDSGKFDAASEATSPQHSGLND